MGNADQRTENLINPENTVDELERKVEKETKENLADIQASQQEKLESLINQGWSIDSNWLKTKRKSFPGIFDWLVERIQNHHETAPIVDDTQTSTSGKSIVIAVHQKLLNTLECSKDDVLGITLAQLEKRQRQKVRKLGWWIDEHWLKTKKTEIPGILAFLLEFLKSHLVTHIVDDTQAPTGGNSIVIAVHQRVLTLLECSKNAILGQDIFCLVGIAASHIPGEQQREMFIAGQQERMELARKNEKPPDLVLLIQTTAFSSNSTSEQFGVRVHTEELKFGGIYIGKAVFSQWSKLETDPEVEEYKSRQQNQVLVYIKDWKNKQENEKITGESNRKKMSSEVPPVSEAVAKIEKDAEHLSIDELKYLQYYFRKKVNEAKRNKQEIKQDYATIESLKVGEFLYRKKRTNQKGGEYWYIDIPKIKEIEKNGRLVEKKYSIPIYLGLETPLFQPSEDLKKAEERKRKSLLKTG